MSRTDNRRQAERWLLTAREDLTAAEALLGAAMYPQACFYCQQAAEKAVKSLWYLIDSDPWGHSVQRLITEFPERDTIADVDTWAQKGALLDQFYIPTRYHNGLQDLTPGQTYKKEDALRGIEAARMLLQGCEKWLEARYGDAKPETS
jgi:HEPN domain-containing protein